MNELVNRVQKLYAFELPGLNRNGTAAVRTARIANNGRTNEGAATSPYT